MYLLKNSNTEFLDAEIAMYAKFIVSWKDEEKIKYIFLSLFKLGVRLKILTATVGSV